MRQTLSRTLLLSAGMIAAIFFMALPATATPIVVAAADEAISDPLYFPAGITHEFAFYMCTADHDCSPDRATPDIGADYIFDPEASWTENSDGTARLLGQAVDRNNASKTFDIDIIFSGRTDAAGAGSPKKELLPNAYVAGGGPIDPSTWHYYTSLSGTLTGGGDYAGAVITVVRTGPSFQVGYGANNKNTNNGASGWLECNILSQPTSGDPIADVDQCDINIDIDVEYCPVQAVPDQYAQYSGGHSIWLPGLALDFDFEIDDAHFVEFADDCPASFTGGCAQMTGTVRSHANPDLAFVVDVRFDDHTQVAPPGSPKKELIAAAYSESGGPIDTSEWRYYTSMTGTLTGIDMLEGAVLSLHPVGPAFQVGVGASGKNLDYGASGWFGWTVVSQPTFYPQLSNGGNGDFNLNLRTDCPALGYCLDEAMRDHLNMGGDHAVAMPGIARDLIFDGDASWFEYPDGTAGFDAVVRDKNDANRKFSVSVVMADRTYAAPAGSPKKELPSSAYLPNGPANPANWWYYPNWSATFVGLGDFAGAEVAVTRRGPAFQVGVGASNKNLEFGASAWFNYQTISQPTGNITFPNSGSGDFNLSLLCPPGQGPPADPEEPPAMPAEGCVAQQAVSYTPGNRANGTPVIPQRSDATKALGEPEGGDWLNFVALGFGGVLELDMGARILNGGGDDFMIVETSYGSPSCDTYPETATVLVSQEGLNWVNVGNTCQDGDFDLGPLPWARYIRIIDTSDAGAFPSDTDGYDVDGVIGVLCEDDTAAAPNRFKVVVDPEFGQTVHISEIRWRDAEGRLIRFDGREVTSLFPNADRVVDNALTTYWTAERSRQMPSLVFGTGNRELAFPTSVDVGFFGQGSGATSHLTFYVSTDRGAKWTELTTVSTSPQGAGGGLSGSAGPLGSGILGGSSASWSVYRFETP